jgi:alpha-1,6-mannosyltransferase
MSDVGADALRTGANTSSALRPPSGHTSGNRVVAVGVFTGILYLAMYVVQRAIHAGPTVDTFRVGLALYPLISIGVLVQYVWVLTLCRRPLTPRGRMAAFSFPVLFSVLWLPVAPVFSSDVFAYIAHGYVNVELGGNPYLVHSSAVAASPIGSELLSYGWRPVHPGTPYGPLLTHLETAIVSISGADVSLSMLLFKLVTVASGLGVAVVIWMILDRVRPQDRDVGTVAYLWSPAVLVEVAGEGHNDAIMTLLAIGTVLLVLRRQVVGGALTMTAAALTKYVPVLLGVVLLRYLWHGAEDQRSMLARLTVGALTGAFVAIALYAPYWDGRQTFSALGLSGRAGHTGSTQTVLAELLSRLVSEQSALRAVSVAAAGTVILAAGLIAVRVRTPIDLLRGSAVLMVIYSLLSPAFWPWYVILPIAFLALWPHGIFLVLLVAMSFGSRLVAPLNSLYVDALIDRPTFFLLTWVGTVGLPLLAVLACRLLHFREVVSNSNGRRYGSLPNRDSAAKGRDGRAAG